MGARHGRVRGTIGARDPDRDRSARTQRSPEPSFRSAKAHNDGRAPHRGQEEESIMVVVDAEETLETRMQRIIATLTVAPSAECPACLLITGLDDAGGTHM